MSTETKTLPALTMPCPRCGEGAASIALNLWTLSDQDGENLACQDCGSSFSLNEVRDLVNRWSVLIGWIGQIPS